MVAPHLDVGGNEEGIRDGRILPAEHYVHAGRFQLIVDDLERPPAVKRSERVRLLTNEVDIGYV